MPTNLIWQTELGESLDETEVDTVEVMSIQYFIETAKTLAQSVKFCFD